jgi:maltose O-acetyltransferase
MKSVYLFSRFTLLRDLGMLRAGIASFIANCLIFPTRSMYAAAARGLVLSPFLKGPCRVRFIMRGVTLEDPGLVFFDTDVVVREGVLIRGGISVGERSFLGRDSIFHGPVTIGADVNINYRCEVYSDTTIGDRCSIGPGVKFLSMSHELGSERFRAGNFYSAPIRVGDGAWIGAYSILLGGVTVGDGAVVGAGSLVTKDIPANHLALGHPAKIVRELGPGYGGTPPGSPMTPPVVRWA